MTLIEKIKLDVEMLNVCCDHLRTATILDPKATTSLGALVWHAGTANDGDMLRALHHLRLPVLVTRDRYGSQRVRGIRLK